jgi:hypothetical protein
MTRRQVWISCHEVCKFMSLYCSIYIRPFPFKISWSRCHKQRPCWSSWDIHSFMQCKLLTRLINYHLNSKNQRQIKQMKGPTQVNVILTIRQVAQLEGKKIRGPAAECTNIITCMCVWVYACICVVCTDQYVCESVCIFVQSVYMYLTIS